MLIPSKVKLPKLLAGIAVLLGGLLMIAGILNGNHVTRTININKEAIQTVSLADVELLKQQYRNKIKIIEFESDQKCLKNIATFKFQKCYKIAQLKDIKWLRKAFSTMKKPVVIFSQNKNDRVYIAAYLEEYGYNVKVLIDDMAVTNNLLINDNNGKLLIALADKEKDKTLDSLLKPVETVEIEDKKDETAEVTIPLTTETDEDDEEEEEEGC